MAVNVLLDREREPTGRDFERAVGAAGPAWRELARRVRDDMGARGSASWGGARSGWELRFRRAGKPFTTLTPQADAFVALVVLGRDHVGVAASAPLTPRARRVFDEAKQYPDGRWVFLRVETPRDLDDVLRLLELKLPPRVRARVATVGAGVPAAGPIGGDA